MAKSAINTPLIDRILLRTIVVALPFAVSLNYLTLSLALAQDSAALFNEKCSGCHSIGGGNLVGPDLAPTAKWGSADLSKAIKNMEKNVGPLTSSEVDSLVEYLKNPKAKASTSRPTDSTHETQTPSLPQPVQISEPASANRGSRLFSGDEALKNGGLSCIACHRVDDSGGTIGPDLTNVSTKMSETALVSACEHTPYKVMKTAYKDHPVVHQEALDLAAYLNSLKEPRKRLKEPPVVVMGFLFAGFVFGVIALGYRNRNTSVRDKLHRRD